MCQEISGIIKKAVPLLTLPKWGFSGSLIIFCNKIKPSEKLLNTEMFIAIC
jgi:hypothetical protein